MLVVLDRWKIYMARDTTCWSCLPSWPPVVSGKLLVQPKMMQLVSSFFGGITKFIVAMCCLFTLSNKWNCLKSWYLFERDWLLFFNAISTQTKRNNFTFKLYFVLPSKNIIMNKPLPLSARVGMKDKLYTDIVVFFRKFPTTRHRKGIASND